MIEFTPWAKIARLNRDITITEKIDGTNAAVGIMEFGPSNQLELDTGATKVPGVRALVGDERYLVYAQSRKSIITPERDNFGFARWVFDNAEVLAATLGTGLHFGEWWGSGIQRGYGLPKGERRFSLFNTKRWAHGAINWQTGKSNEGMFDAGGPQPVRGLDVVPVLYEGPFGERESSSDSRWLPWEVALHDLRIEGSQASPGFMNPEGIVIYHKAANMMFKVTLKNDEEPKSLKVAA